MITSLEPILREHPFFHGMPEPYLTLLTGCAKNIRVEAGKFLFREKEEAKSFYLIREGRIQLEVASPKLGAMTIQTIGPGEVLGWSWLFPPYQWHFDARIVEPVRALALDGKCLRGKCETDPALGYDLMKRFASLLIQRLQATRLQLVGAHEER